MNLHRLACRFGQHIWTVSDEESYPTDASCEVCEKPHPLNVDMQCQLGGHVWGPWGPLTPKTGTLTLTQKASTTLGAELLAQLEQRSEEMWGKTVVDKEPTQCRRCTRCDRYEDNGERHYTGGWMNNIMLAPSQAGSFTWTEDRLNPEAKA